jgi:hypothetical protein
VEQLFPKCVQQDLDVRQGIIRRKDGEGKVAPVLNKVSRREGVYVKVKLSLCFKLQSRHEGVL